MANPRQLAEQAFALLQNALRDSEARASDLDEQLKRRKAPKNKAEEQLEVLTHRVESLDAECARWRQQAGHLEEVAEAERAKVAQLKKKLEIAESGPEKLTKKEINFWRGKAEDIDTETREYKDRLASLRREIMERDELIAKLERGQAPAAYNPAPRPALSETSDTVLQLRGQLEQRDQWLSELRHELHELRTERATPEAPLETQAEIETLRRKTVSLEAALTEAHNMRAAAQADFTRAKQELEARLRSTREFVASDEHARATLADREHRIVELSAEVEKLRKELDQHGTQHRASAAERDQRLAALDKELAEARTAAREAQQKAESAHGELNQLRTALGLAERRAADTGTELARLQTRLAERERETQGTAEAGKQLQDALAEREKALAERDAEIEKLRQAATDGERALAEQTKQLENTEHQLSQRERQAAALTADLEHAVAAAADTESELASARDALHDHERNLEELRGEKERLDAALAESRARIEASEGALAETRARIERAETESASAREQIEGLEAELKEEKEHAENMSELANERREHMTKLQEQLEEAEERFAEADWRLGKARHFERLVKRRKGLIAKLLDALRAKNKANTALKAGLDGLRTYKAGAEMNQQKLLQRIEVLKTDLNEAQDTIARHQGATLTKADLAEAEARAMSLEDRLNTQAELIQSLEADLKTARLAQKSGGEKSQEIERLQHELDQKNDIIARLQADTDEQQRKLSKLRGSESETMRLKALTEKDRSEIEALQREVATLREALVRKGGESGDGGGGGADTAELEAKLKERESSVTRLMGTVKEHESTIKKLNEAVEGWKRKYQFLAAEEPQAYKTAAEK